VAAVDDGPLAVDNHANHDRTKVLQNATLRAVRSMRAVLLRGSFDKTNAVAFSAVQPHREEVLKAASNTFVAEEQTTHLGVVVKVFSMLGLV
jgi:hypothetical protein